MSKITAIVTELKVEFKNTMKRMDKMDENIKSLLETTIKNNLQTELINSRLKIHMKDIEKRDMKIDRILELAIGRITTLEKNQSNLYIKVGGIMTFITGFVTWIFNK